MAYTARERRRYNLLRAFGIDCVFARAGSNNVQIFCDILYHRGLDPYDYGDLAVKKDTGKPRLYTPESIARTERYHTLRGFGLSPSECNEHGNTEGVFRRYMRRRELGIIT